MSLVHVQILVIDEVHQLLAGSAREQRLSLNLIKSISNDLRISIVAAGTGDARHAIEADPQIRRRFDPFALLRWTENEDFLHASEVITGPVTRLLSLVAVEAIRNSAEHIDEAGIDRAATRLERDAA